MGVVVLAGASLATWVISCLSTTSRPRSLSVANEGVLVHTRTGPRAPSVDVVTAAKPSSDDVVWPRARASSAWDDGTTTTARCDQPRPHTVTTSGTTRSAIRP
jgi:hypothetical protein